MLKKQIEPCGGTRREVQFEWSQYSILTTDSKVRTAFPDSIFDTEKEKVKARQNNGQLQSGKSRVRSQGRTST